MKDTITINDAKFDIGAPLRFDQIRSGEVFLSKNSGAAYVKLERRNGGCNALRIQPGPGAWFRTFALNTLIDPLSPSPLVVRRSDDALNSTVDMAVSAMCRDLDEAFPGYDGGGISSNFQGYMTELVKHFLLYGTTGPHAAPRVPSLKPVVEII